jgi:hypothetical protein
MEEKFSGLTAPKKGHARTQHRVPTDQLANMDGLNVRHRQPRPHYTGQKTFIAKTRRHMEEQFTVLGDQIKALTTQFSNMGSHNRDGSEDPSTVSTVHKLVPINGETDSNSIFWNSKGIYNPKNFWIRCWLLKRFLNSTRCSMNDESLWWYTHSREELCGGNN